MESEELNSDIAYKCSFCDVIFTKFESILKHNNYYCPKRRILPRSCTVTTAMLSSPRPPDESVVSHGSNSAVYSRGAAAIGPHEDSKLVPKFDKSPQVNPMGMHASNRGYMLPRGTGAIAVVGLSKSGATYLGSPVQSEPLEAAADFKPTSSAALTLPRMHANSRLASSGATLQREHMNSQILQAAADFMHPTSAAITLQRLKSRVAEAAAGGRLATSGTTLHHDRMNSNSNILGAKEDSELQGIGTKRKKLSDDEDE